MAQVSASAQSVKAYLQRCEKTFLKALHYLICFHVFSRANARSVNDMRFALGLRGGAAFRRGGEGQGAQEAESNTIATIPSIPKWKWSCVLAVVKVLFSPGHAYTYTNITGAVNIPTKNMNSQRLLPQSCPIIHCLFVSPHSRHRTNKCPKAKLVLFLVSAQRCARSIFIA